MFLEQFEKLRSSVPRLSLMNFRDERSPFCNFTYKCVDCYSTTGSDFLKNSHYNYWGYYNKNCVDSSYCRSCEECYECLDCRKCKDSSFLQDCEDCENSHYCFDCQDLRDCFACIGLWRKQYFIYNKLYSKDAYFETVAKLKKKQPNELRKLFKEVKKIRPHIYMRANHEEGLCTGDYISNSDSCQFCFDVEKCLNCLYMNNTNSCMHCTDVSFAGEDPVVNSYEIMSGMGLHDCNFCSTCWYGKNLEYCEYCFECEHCFGCTALKNRKFYILNLPYSPDEYFKKVEEIKTIMKRTGEYGRWFKSPYPIEDTKAAEEFACVGHDHMKSQRFIIQEEKMEIEWEKILR